MKLTASREEILTPVQNVIGVVERRQTMPVLSNVLLSARDGKLSVTGTDLEVELVSSISLNIAAQGDITVPGRKFLDILRALPEGVNVTLSTESDRLVVREAAAQGEHGGPGDRRGGQHEREPRCRWPLESEEACSGDGDAGA